MYSSPRINDLEHKVSRNLSMVKLFYQNRDYDTAKTYVNEALKLKPHSSEAYKLLSQIHEATGDNALAMEYYKKALELRANSFDGNSSFENHNNNSSPNSRHFTSTKSSPSSFNHFGGGGGWSGTPPNNISPSSFVNNNNNVSPQHSANTENIEQLLDGKITTLLSNFQASVNEKITLLGVSVERIVGDVSGIKKKLEDVQKKLFMIGNKQEEMSGKLQATSAAVAAAASTVPLPSKDSSADVKRQIEALSRSLGNLAGDNSKILLELSELKEAVILLNEKGNFSDDYDEEEYDENDDDYEDDSQQERQQRSSFSKNSSEKPKLGTLTKKVDKDAWNCPTCDTPNSNSASACACCETENPNTAKNTTNAPGSVSEFKFGTPSGTSAFSFGVPAAAATTATSTATSSSASSFSGFNISSSVSNAPPAFGVASNSTPIFGTVSSTNNTAKSATPASSFSFNSALTAVSASVVPTFGSFGAGSGNAQQSSSISSTLPSTFPSFGSANAATKPADLIPSGESSPFTALSSAFPTFGDAAKSTTTSAAPFSGLSSSFKFPTFGGDTSLGAPIFNANSSNQTGSSLFNSATLSTNEKPLLNALLSGTAPPTTTTAHAFSSFSFNTSPTKGSPEKTTTTANDDNDEENYVESGTDGDYFKLPDVKLPEKYDQVTGEENEMVSFEKKAKLYIFKGDEYKERGVGILKILTDDQTKKSRVLMRRDHIFKVCLNARLADMTNFEIVDHKFLRFSAIDFSEDDRPTSGVFLLKFGNPDLLPVFKCLVETMNNKNFGKSANFESEQESTSSERKVEELSEVKDEGKEEQQSSTVDSSDEVELVFFKEPKAEHLETVKKLMLPPNFYDYEDKPACPGCIGCNDDINFSELTQEIVEKPETPKVNLATPETSNSDPSSNTGSGLFSSIATDLNLAQNKADTIGSSEEAIDNDHMNDKNFVSEKSKLLPEKFEVKTGEEDEEVLFNERCKIYHYVNDEWKERGVGNMKILKRKNSNVFRLLMRRDKIFNVVCNQGIAKGLNLKPFQNSNNTLTWAARDYSDEAAGLDKLFALKFKTETLVKEFEKTINECIEKTSQ